MVVTMDLLQFFVNVGFVLILVWQLGWGVEGKFWAQLIGVAVYSILGIYYFLRFDLLGWMFDRKMLAVSLAFSVPLMPNLLGGWINGLSDRIIITAVINTSETGIYSIARQISMVYYVFIQACSLVYTPMIFAMMKKDESEGLQRLSNYVPNYAILMLFFAFVLSLFSREVVLLMTEQQYHSGFVLIPVLVMASFWGAMYQPFVPLLSYKKLTLIISSGAIVQALLNLALNIIFIPKYGKMAAAWTTQFAVLTYFLWMFYWSQRHYPVRLPYGRLLRAAVIVALCWYARRWTWMDNVWATIVSKMGLTLILVILLLVFRCFGPEVWGEIRGFKESLMEKFKK
jgi:O-antigen/teichoic acid export membrane protein